MLIRPHHWLKNLLCFCGLAFSNSIVNSQAIRQSIIVFVCFCITSSIVYIFNDIVDRNNDSAHPKKRKRPIASGNISVLSALSLVIFLSIVCIALLKCLNAKTFFCIVLYLILNVLYTTNLKRIFLIDVFCIGFGFALRTVSGIYCINESPTVWIITCVFFLTTLIGFGKRKSELNIVTNETLTRDVLKEYKGKIVDFCIYITACLTVFNYIMFTIFSQKNVSLILTIPIVLYGIFYYLKIVHTTNLCEEPEKLITNSKPLFICLITWLITYFMILKSNFTIFLQN